MKYAHLVWGNLKRKKLRTLLTLLSILVAFVLFGLLCSIRQALIGALTKTPRPDRGVLTAKIWLFVAGALRLPQEA